MKNSFFKKISIFVFFLVAVFILFNGNNINAYSISKNPAGIAVTYYDDIEEWAWQLLLGKEHKKLNHASGIQDIPDSVDSEETEFKLEILIK